MYDTEQLTNTTLADVLEAQHGAIARWQAAVLGIGGDAFERRVRSGAWQSPYRGVAVHAAWRHHPRAPLAAAVLRAGRGARLALWSAGELVGLDVPGSSELVHLWVPHADRRPSAPPGLEVRRSSHLSSALDVTERQHLPVTTRERLVVDRLARPLSAAARESFVAEVLQKDLTTEARLAACAARNLPGAAVLRSILGLVAGFDSGLELVVDRLARSVGLRCEPGVTVVHPDGTADELDLLAEREGVDVEADGWAFHRDPAQREADELRDERLRATGLIVVRITSRQATNAQDESRDRLRRAADGRQWTPPPGVTLERRRRAA